MAELKDKIVIADDAEINRELLKDIFENRYEIIETENGEEALAALEANPDTRLLLLDLVMPKMDGLEVLDYMANHGMMEKIPVIMITGESTRKTELSAYEYGVAEVVYKPFEPTITLRRAENAIELYKQRNYMAQEIARKNKELLESQNRIIRNNNFLIMALGNVVEFRSAESGEHVQRVSEYTRVLLEYVKRLYPKYGLTQEMITEMSQAAALHDLGKIAIPDSILNAPRKLTAEEFAEMKKHTIYGCEMLEKFKQVDSDFYKYCYDIIRWHHERDDGRGYPDGLSGEDIPIYAQATGVADCFDALVSKRVYKAAFPIETAFDMILNGECGKFSDVILTAFKAARQSMFKIAEDYSGRG